MRWTNLARVLSLLCLTLLAGVESASAQAVSQTVARCGRGWLETIDGYAVLHLKGTPYEMGYQQGALLRERVQSNMHNLLVKKAGERIKMGLVQVKPRAVIESILQVQKPFVPAKYFEEMEGLADGAADWVFRPRISGLVAVMTSSVCACRT